MADEPQVDFGTMFRQARERRGLTLQQLAAVTKISARVLDALERNDVSKLPGGIFSRSFVRSYAREIGLDPAMVVERFIDEFPVASGAEQMPSTKEAEDIEAYESGRRAATTVLQVVGLSVVVIAIVFFAIRMGGSRSSTPAPAAAPVPATQVQPPASTPPEAPPAAASQPIAAPPAEPAAAPATAAQTTPPPQPAAPASTGAIAVTIATDAECWLMVKTDKTVVFERILQPGEKLTYGAQSSVTISAGNAGAIQWTLNGRAAKPLGNKGQVITATVTLETLSSFVQ